jgi:cell division transport system permease protein
VSRWKPGPLLPASDRRDGALTFVVAVLAFLACLTGVAALGANRAAEGWHSQLVGAATVLVRPKTGETADGAAARATETLAGVKGVQEAAMMEREQAEDLLRPWLGEDILPDLPIPRLVTVELDRKAPATATAMTQALAAAGVDATVDDHSLWIKDIVRAGQMARLAALGCALLLAAAAAAVVTYATRASITAWSEAVGVLHLLGAEDRQIAGLFQRRFARLAAISAGWGALFAIVVAALLRAAGGPGGLTPILPVAWSDLLLPLAAPIVAAGIGALAARRAAMKLLQAQP